MIERQTYSNGKQKTKTRQEFNRAASLDLLRFCQSCRRFCECYLAHSALLRVTTVPKRR